MSRAYQSRNPGDIIANGAILVERVDRRLWKIRCSCGNVFISQPAGCSGRCRQCGYKINAETRTKHGEAPDNNHNASRLYSIWLNMRQRCNNPKIKCFNLYGGRGISVCDEWNDYVVFKQWAMSNGYRDDLTLDRIDFNGNYEPLNCRWITQKEQCRNKRDNRYITYNGETKTMVEWSEITGIPYHTLKRRLNRYHFNLEEAFTIPPIKGNNQQLRNAEGE